MCRYFVWRLFPHCIDSQAKIAKPKLRYRFANTRLRCKLRCCPRGILHTIQRVGVILPGLSVSRIAAKKTATFVFPFALFFFCEATLSSPDLSDPALMRRVSSNKVWYCSCFFSISCMTFACVAASRVCYVSGAPRSSFCQRYYKTLYAITNNSTCILICDANSASRCDDGLGHGAPDDLFNWFVKNRTLNEKKSRFSGFCCFLYDLKADLPEITRSPSVSCDEPTRYAYISDVYTTVGLSGSRLTESFFCYPISGYISVGYPDKKYRY